MLMYDGSMQHDILLGQWWVRLYESGDLGKCIAPKHHALGDFLVMLKNTSLLFELNDSGVSYAAWFEEALWSGFVGVWVTPDLRSHAHALHIQAFGWAFQRWAVVTSLTWQPEVAIYMRRLGFHVAGKIPTTPQVIVLWAEEADFERYRGRYGSHRNGSEGGHAGPDQATGPLVRKLIQRDDAGEEGDAGPGPGSPPHGRG